MPSGARAAWWRHAAAEEAEAVSTGTVSVQEEHPSRATRVTEAALELFCPAAFAA